MNKIKISVLDREDLFKFSALFYEELLLQIPEDAFLLGAIDTTDTVPKAAGLLIFHLSEGDAYIDWLFVDEACRKRGVGKALIDFLKELFTKDSDQTVDVIFMNFDETIEGMGRFLRNNDFGVTFYDGNFNIYAPLKSVRLMDPNNNVRGDFKTLPLSEIPDSTFDELEKHIMLTDDDFVIGVVPPIRSADFRAESRAVLNGNRIVGIMLVSDTIYKNNIVIDWVYSIPRYVLKAVPLAFDAVISELRKSLPGNTMISMASLTDNVGGIIRKTMPGAVFLEAYSAFWIVDR